MKVVMLRRSFLVGLGLAAGGLALGVERDAIAAPPPSKPDVVPANEPGARVNAFVHVAPDGIVSIVCHRSEMGQGVRSSLPVLIADEMGADMAKVRVLQGDGDKRYGDQNTDGSSSVRKGFEDLRKAGAAARLLLVAAAAKRWKVKPETCTARDHVVVHQPTNRSIGFGALVADAAKLDVPSGKDIKLRPRSELRHLGVDLPLLDGQNIVTGRAIFAADVRLPGMLTAVVARPPVVGAKVARYDAKKALAITGVSQVVEIPAPSPPWHFKPLGGVAVIARDTWAAMMGRAALEITWERADNDAYESGSYRDALRAAVGKPGDVVRKTGDVDAALSSAAERFEAEYHVPHLAHAPMEPPAAVARAGKDDCEVWACTQDPQTAQGEVAKALGISKDKVTIHVTFLGGGFGRKSKPDFIVEAAMLSRAVGAPVRVQWTREDDIQHDYFHTVAEHRLTAALDGGGKVVGWLHRSAFPAIKALFLPGVGHPADNELQQGILDFPLAIPNVRAESGEAKAHVRVGWLRSVHNIHSAFAIGSFVDELAHAKKMDPKDAWLEIVGPPRIVSTKELGVGKLDNYGQSLDDHPIDTGRLRGVIERVTSLSRWAEQRKAGRALGLAAHRSFLSYVAVVVSTVLDPGGKVRVDEAWIALDAGTIVNRDRVRAQMEGAVIFGISIAMHGSITMRGGAVVETNFRDYKLARIGEAPRAIHVDILPSEGQPGGVGEPGVPPVAPAIANAVFALTGKRIRDLPLSRAGLA